VWHAFASHGRETTDECTRVQPGVYHVPYTRIPRTLTQRTIREAIWRHSTAGRNALGENQRSIRVNQSQLRHLTESAAVEISRSLPDFILRIHYKRSIADYRLVDSLAAY
jgi:hypothetical protein